MNYDIYQEFCEALKELHVFTGCDTVSSFASKGKTKPLKIMKSQQKYVSTLENHGIWKKEKDLLQNLEVQCMETSSKTLINNCATRSTAQNVVRFHVRFLPPCKTALIEHCKRANYQ